MKEPHNYRAVGYSMIVVAGSLALIGIITLAIGSDVLFADRIQRAEGTGTARTGQELLEQEAAQLDGTINLNIKLGDL